jgi:hypothetical protein
MAVTQLSRFKGGKPEDMIAAARKAKVAWEKQGADEFRLGRLHTGAWSGDWVVAIRFKDFAAYARAAETLAKDPEYQQLMSHVTGMSELMGRNIIMGVDL